jgi:hypothetical protein
MPFDKSVGCWTPGSNGRGTHHGEPLDCDQIRELPDGAEVVITWSGGNGPHPYRVLVDRYGERRVEALYCDPILFMDSPESPQRVPLNRVTLGWDDATRAWHESKISEPEHIQQRWRTLRATA